MQLARTAFAMILSMAAFAPLGSAAQNLLLNGSFETGLASWTSNGGVCVPSTQNAGGSSTGAGAWTAPAPANGAFVYMGDTGAPGVCTLSQDVTLPAGIGTGTLSYAAGYNFQDFGGGPGGCSVSVAVTDLANAPIATGYTVANNALNDPMAARTLSFSTTPGATVRVLLTETSCAGGPAGLVADAFALIAGTGAQQVPTLGEWAKVLLALMLAATAMLYLRKRA